MKMCDVKCDKNVLSWKRSLRRLKYVDEEIMNQYDIWHLSPPTEKLFFEFRLTPDSLL